MSYCPHVAISITMRLSVSISEMSFLFTFDMDIKIPWVHWDHSSDVYLSIDGLTGVVEWLSCFYVEVSSLELGTRVDVSHNFYPMIIKCNYIEYLELRIIS
jgi:hypothetical protein